jgi:hypothetical protein
MDYSSIYCNIVFAPFERGTTVRNEAKNPIVSMVIQILDEWKQSLWHPVDDGAPEEIVEF